ncbi:hypothetical protein BC829DRAFT_437526 [Chytridium lagenaria]|nr:hypothetical protein BC829DRAFT_437526 [Chytridium lagenaria]
MSTSAIALNAKLSSFINTTSTPSAFSILRPSPLLLRAFASKSVQKTAEQEEATKIRRALRALPKTSTEPPKRPLTSYILFLGDKRGEISELEEVKRMEKKERAVAVVKKAAEMWGHADGKVKEKYASLAQSAREAYKKSLKEYLANRTPEDLIIQKSTRRFQKKLSPRARAKVLSDPNAPRRPVSGYMKFCMDLHKGVDVEGVDKGVIMELGIGERGREMGRLWRGLSKAMKEKYIKASDKDKERYRKELEAYNKKSGMGDAKEAVNEERRKNLQTMKTRRKAAGRRKVVAKKKVVVKKKSVKKAVPKKAVAKSGDTKKTVAAKKKVTVSKPAAKKKAVETKGAKKAVAGRK